MRANTVFLLSLNWSCNRVFPANMRFVFLQGFLVCVFLLLFILRKVIKYLPLLVIGTIPPIGPIPSLQSSFWPFIALAEDSQKTSTAPGRSQNIFQDMSAASFHRDGTGYLHMIMSLLVTETYTYTYKYR